MMAAKNGNTDTVRILLEHGADVNSKNVHGNYILCHNIYLSINL